MHRRQFLSSTLVPAIRAGGRRPDRVVLISLLGGMAQTDTFDPKHYTPFEPGMLSRNLLGTCRSIPTAAPGVRFGVGLEGIAGRMHRGCVVRSVFAPPGLSHIAAQRLLLEGVEMERAGAGNFAGQMDAAVSLLRQGPARVRVTLPFVPFGGLDTHDAGADRIAAHKRTIDAPIAGLLDRLERGGLLETTLVMVASEFGRTIRPGTILSRRDYGFHEHSPDGFSVLLFGAGVPHGVAYGRTAEEHPMVPVEKAVSILDVDATIRRILGLDGAAGRVVPGLTV